MDKQKYSKCVGDAMRGKKFSADQRKREFCIASKLCSQKSSSREQANEICEQAALNPKPSKSKPKKSRDNGNGMRLILLTTADCKPCSAAKQILADKLASGFITEFNIQKSTEASDLVAKYKLDSVPKLLVLDETGAPFSELHVVDQTQTL